MIKLILTRIYATFQACFYARQREESRQKMMAYYLKLKPNRLSATYKNTGDLR